MQFQVTAKCQSVEKGEDADVIELHSIKSDPDDAKGLDGTQSYQVDAILKLTLDDPATRGQFEVGNDYGILVTISPPEQPANLS